VNLSFLQVTQSLRSLAAGTLCY